MAEPEELISDAARHATVFAQRLWLKHKTLPSLPQTVTLSDVTTRLDLLITALFDNSYPLRSAQLPARPTLLSKLFRHDREPRRQYPIPATDGVSIWLPPDTEITDSVRANELYRAMALSQVVRARRGGAELIASVKSMLQADVFLLLEAYAADEELAASLPGIAKSINVLRQHALKTRPALAKFSDSRKPLELLLRKLLSNQCGHPNKEIALAPTPQESLVNASQVIHDFQLLPNGTDEHRLGPYPLVRDWWTGELQASPTLTVQTVPKEKNDLTDPHDSTPRSARLSRRPDEREVTEDEQENEQNSSIWMVQPDDSHQHAEDPFGLQRPTDRDQDTSADEFGEMVSELSNARLISTPDQPKEVLLSDDPPDSHARQELKAAISEGKGFRYPEWDYRQQFYRDPGATVRLLSSHEGSQQWVDKTLAAHESMLSTIRKRFEMLQARRVTCRKQLDGDDIDLDAYIESYNDFRAGTYLNEALYQTRRTIDRNMAITLLIDISGSTDSWVSANRRVIDVEREALLLVCVALEGLGEPYSVQAFSGEGPHAVTVRQIKDFDEPYNNSVALRISALEPQHYTRTGAAIRHATVDLMRKSAAHRLLLLISDGKPSDKDDYEGRYGVEDMRQSITEARLQNIHCFCLTIDRQAASYLPRVFGSGAYTLITKPESLSSALLDWMKRLITI
ncbi:nitric oxide reductase activation protein NorD [Methylophaga sp.]|uniref:nitric oxide reductase activation protein NorD n=1 Tax=Methylophaga sp. TaxID=2024840 RepID=UPI003F6A3D1D